MPPSNGRNGEMGNKGHSSELETIEDWLFLTPTADDARIMMTCTDEAIITADTWSTPGIERGMRGRKIVLVFAGKENPEQIEVARRFRESKAQSIRIWRPMCFGDPLYTTLDDYNQEFRLPLVLALEQPWLIHVDVPGTHPNGPIKLTIGLDEIEVEVVDWFYENRIAPGLISLFAGRSGMGKSFVTCDIVARFSRGEPGPFGEIRHPPMRTLFISEDSPTIVLGPRLIELRADREMVRFMTFDAMAQYLIGDTAFLERAYQECGCPKLIVIDPPANFLGSVDEHKNAEVRAVLKTLIAWLDMHRVAAILITHINKQIGKGMDSVERIMGSVAWGSVARITCAFTKDPNQSGMMLFGGTKNNIGEKAEALAYRIVKTDNLATVEWHGTSDANMDDAIDNIKKKSRGKCAVEWLVERFREKIEWESSELKQAAREAGVSNNALFSPEVNALPIDKKRRTNANGDVYYVWRSSSDAWPDKQHRNDRDSGIAGTAGTQPY